MSPRGLRVVVLSFAVVSISRNLRAADADNNVETMIQQGIALRKAGKDDKAIQVLRRAYELSPTPRTAAQVGLCEHSLGLWVSSEAHLKEALGSSRDPWIARNRKALQSSLDFVGTHLATVEIRGEPRDATVTIDGEVVGKLPLIRPIRVVAGQSRLEVTAAGHFKATRTIVTNPGYHTRETVILKEEGNAREPAVAPFSANSPAGRRSVTPSESVSSSTNVATTSPPAWMRPAAWALGGVSLAALAVAISQHVVAVNRANQFGEPGRTNLTASTRCDADLPEAGGGECPALLEARDRAMRVAIFTYVTSGILAGGSAVLFFLSRPKETSAMTTAFLCDSGPGLVGVSCAFTF